MAEAIVQRAPDKVLSSYRASRPKAQARADIDLIRGLLGLFARSEGKRI